MIKYRVMISKYVTYKEVYSSIYTIHDRGGCYYYHLVADTDYVKANINKLEDVIKNGLSKEDRYFSIFQCSTNTKIKEYEYLKTILTESRFLPTDSYIIDNKEYKINEILFDQNEEEWVLYVDKKDNLTVDENFKYNSELVQTHNELFRKIIILIKEATFVINDEENVTEKLNLWDVIKGWLCEKV